MVGKHPCLETVFSGGSLDRGAPAQPYTLENYQRSPDNTNRFSLVKHRQRYDSIFLLLVRRQKIIYWDKFKSGVGNFPGATAGMLRQTGELD
jgi:hypothetical protein